MNVYTMWVVDRVSPDVKIHENDFYQIIYCNREGGKIFVGGKWHMAVEGNIYFANPMEKRAIEQHGNLRVTDIKFVVDPEETSALLKKVPSVFSVNDDMQLLRAFKDVVNEGFGREAYSGESTDAALALLLVKIIRKFVFNAADGTVAKPSFELPPWSVTMLERNGDERMKMLVEYIERHIAEPITLDDLSEFIHLNKSYLGERFKAIWGVPPMKYVNWVRVERAKELLLTTDVSITDIAEKTGFQSIHYFSRFFKQKENMTPQEYRAQYRNRE